VPVELSETAQKALRLFEEGCVSSHTTFVSKLQERMSAYHGVLEQSAARRRESWQSNLHPPLIEHIVESSLAAIVDGRLTFRVKPRARFYEPEEYEQARLGAQAHEILHNAQLADDRFAERQQPFALQDAIAGITVAKNHWCRDVRIRPRLKVVPDERGLELGVFLPRLVEEETVDLRYDGPTTEVVNVEDFYWHEAATELQKSPVVAHAVWMHHSELKRLEELGYYQNVDEIKNAGGSGPNAKRVVDGTSRSKDMVELLEIWWREPDGIYSVALGERKVELSPPRKNPFWHGEYPFVVCTTRPDLFSIPGKSQVERIADIQQAHWDLTNQMLDNVRLINNAIFIVGDEVTDPDALEFYPGARWPVEGDPNQMVMPWTPQAFPAQVALPHLANLEQMMQNIAGGHPFTSTSEATTVGADTATEAALATNIAERATVRLREALFYAYGRIGQQRTELNQQFLRTDIMVERIGLDSESEFVRIAPYLLQGDYLFDVTPMVESLMRSERRAEANAKLQMFTQCWTVYLQLAKAGLATPLNADEFMRDWLQSYDESDVDRYFSKKPVDQAGAQMPGQPPPPGAEPPQGIPAGVTAPQSIDPAMSPSAQGSLSGETMLQRTGTMRGGPANV